jgi:hypothetical protein
MSEAKHKCRSSSGVLKETRTKNFRTSNITIMQKTMWYFGTMHVTLRMTIMLSIVDALKKEGETLEPWLLMARLKTRGWKQRLNKYQSS